MSIPEIRHDQESSRFVATTPTGDAELTYMRDGKRIVFTHTGVPPEHEGQGIGGALARAGLDYARSEGLTVRPMCPFVAAYVKRNPEYHPLVEQRPGG
jgi:predicted GNAT family acetyltransferase